MKLANRDFLKACQWENKRHLFADVVYPPAPREHTVWTYDDPAIQAAFDAEFAPA